MDIAERLLEWGDNPQDVSHGELAEYSFVAHDEIKNLRQQNAELVEAIGKLLEAGREQLRTADYHIDDCKCVRCANDKIAAIYAKATGGE